MRPIISVVRFTRVAFLLPGALGAGLSFAAYGDLVVSYRPDGMILCNGEPFFPIGVYYIPCPQQMTVARFLGRVEAEGRGFIFQEFAADGGNFLCAPSFHFNLPAQSRWDDYFPCDVTDNNPETPPPNECTLDLTFAEEYGMKLAPGGFFAYDWDHLLGYAYWPYGYPPFYLKCGIVDYHGDTRGDASRALYFGQVKDMVEASGAEESYFCLTNFHEGPWRPWSNYFYPDPKFPGEPLRETTSAEQVHVYEHLRDLEELAGGTRPVAFEECIAGIVADLLRQYNAACDVLGYNVRIFPAPNKDYNYINNPWASVTGDAADMHYWSVDGAKPLICCVDAVWAKKPGTNEYYFPTEHQVRFMTYDAIIHRCNGLTWGAYHYVYPPNAQPNENAVDEGYWFNVRPVLREVGTAGVMHEVLKATFDDTMVEAIVRKDGVIVERTAIVGGDLAPKSHICSGNYFIEGCLKYYEGHVYLIAAHREGRDSITGEPDNVYQVTFKPYFSGEWADEYVMVVNEDLGPGRPRTVPVIDGTFTDTFHNEDVHIYKFTKPTPFTAEP